jgi:membrane-bound metal-dependent hydrolase YbcI (DUF457 family)
MPLPLAHALLGTAIAERVLPLDMPHRARALWAAAGLAVAPDLDFFFVWVLGMDRDWHRSFTHSIPFAVAVGIALLAMRPVGARTALAWTLALASHDALDWLTTLDGPGVQLWWPVSEERYGLGVAPFLEFYVPDASGPLDTLRQVLKDSTVEVLLFLPLLVLSRTSLLRNAR